MKRYFYVLSALALISCGSSDKKSTAESTEESATKVEAVQTVETAKAPIDKGTVKSTASKEVKETAKPVVDAKKINASATKIKAQVKSDAEVTAAKVEAEVKSEVKKELSKSLKRDLK